jgi:ATP-dependent DNA ligase
VHVLPFPQELVLARSVGLLPAAGDLPGGCVYEPKFDGYRALLFVDDGRCRIQSRLRHDITGSFPDVAAAACNQLPSGLVLDGELVVRVDDRHEFSELQHRLVVSTEAGSLAHEKPATFVAFDLLCAEDRDARTMPFRDRRAALAKILPELGQVLQLTPQTGDRSEAESWMADFAAGTVDGMEGVVAKGAAQPYRPGKRDWLKFRVQDTLEVVVGAITGPLTAPDRLVLGQYDATGQLVIIGGTDSLGGRERRLIAPLLQLPKNSHPWPSEIAVHRLGRWAVDRQLITRVEPTLVVEVTVDDTGDPEGSQPIAEFVRARPDLAVEETEPFGWRDGDGSASLPA